MASTFDVEDEAQPTRRDFLYIATGSMAAVGAALVAWPLIDQMNPDAAALALASIEVDVSALESGMSLTVKWRGKPVFIRNRTEKEIDEAKSVPVAELPDPMARNANLAADAPATDENRSAAGSNGGGGAAPPGGAAGGGGAPSTASKEAWLIQIGICTHLGCVPLGQQGPYGGYFCPCHGSVYDTAGRIRSGPAPENLHIPVYSFVTDTKLKIG